LEVRVDERQKRALGALASMVDHYLPTHDDGLVNSLAMSPGEHAIAALAEFGYMQEVDLGRIFGRWTEAGLALLDWNYPYDEQARKIFPTPTP